MRTNILREDDIQKIYLIFPENGFKKKVEVELQYLDETVCYFRTGRGSNFVKPQLNIPAEVQVYKDSGTYKTNVKLLDVNFSLSNVMYQVDVPVTWTCLQRNSVSASKPPIDFDLTFNDGFKITDKTLNYTDSEVSFIYKGTLPTVYQKVSAHLTLIFPPNAIPNLKDGKLQADAKCIKSNDSVDEDGLKTTYVFRYMTSSVTDATLVKHYIESLH